MFYLDWYYIVLVVPAIVLSLWASANVNRTFKKYSSQLTRRGITGAEAAMQVLRANGVSNVRVERVSGKLTDHYDPRANVIRLSDDVYTSRSTAAIGVACHEAGHAVQHAVGYFPIKLRTAIIPITNIGSKLALPLILVGLLFINSSLGILIDIGILCFSLSAIFQLVTLPTEFNASRRALIGIQQGHILYDDEIVGAKRTLRAAALTYVAALAVSLAQLLRLVLLFGGRRSRN